MWRYLGIDLQRLAGFVLVCCGFTSAAHAGVTVKDVRLWAGPQSTRIVLDLSAPVQHSFLTLENPERIVVDLENAALQDLGSALPAGQGFVKQMRVGPQEGGDLRLVVDLTAPATAKIFSVEPTAGLGHRLVVDLFPTGKKGSASSAASVPTIVKAAPQGDTRDIVIAIDAGHGGTDPGSIGRNGTYEKNVTLAIARVLKARIDQEPGMRAVLTRETDVFLPLRERINRARDRKADMFVSIHADAYHDRSVTGSSVYVLSARGASDEASRWLAQRENAADLIGGVSLEDKDDVLASVLLDLSQGASMSASIEAADTVLRELRNVGNIKRETVQQAGFLVLKSPDIPSMLVETAFITNPQEEKKLSNPAHQQKLAGAIHAGIRNYFYDNPPPGTRIAQLRNRLQAGAVVATATDGDATGGAGAGISH